MEKTNKLPSVMMLLAALCFSIFLIYGIYFNIFGVDADVTMAFFEISESQQGLIMTVQSVGSFIMTIILGLYGEKINKLKGLSIGAALVAIGGIAIGTIPKYMPQGSGYALILIYGLIGGIGYITIDLLMNGVISDVFPENSHTLLPFVHAFFGTGAMIAPMLVSSLANPNKPQSFAVPFLIVGIAIAVVCIIFIFVCIRVMPSTPYADMTEIKKRVSENPAEIFKIKKAWFFLFACFLHVAFQNGLSLWLTSYCQKEMLISYEKAAMMLSLFFVGNLSMRFLAPVIYRKISVRNYYKIFITAAAVVFFIFVLADLPLAVKYILIVLLGFLQGGGVPTLIIICCDAFPERSASASSLFVFGVCLSSFIMPTLTGKMIELFGFLKPMIMLGVFLALSVVVLEFSKKFD